MTQPFPCTRLEHEFNRMFQRVPKPETPVPMDEETTEDQIRNLGTGLTAARRHGPRP